jgi:hypothetical protein
MGLPVARGGLVTRESRFPSATLRSSVKLPTARGALWSYDRLVEALSEFIRKVKRRDTGWRRLSVEFEISLDDGATWIPVVEATMHRHLSFEFSSLRTYYLLSDGRIVSIVTLDGADQPRSALVQLLSKNAGSRPWQRSYGPLINARFRLGATVSSKDVLWAGDIPYRRRPPRPIRRGLRMLLGMLLASAVVVDIRNPLVYSLVKAVVQAALEHPSAVAVAEVSGVTLGAVAATLIFCMSAVDALSCGIASIVDLIRIVHTRTTT